MDTPEQPPKEPPKRRRVRLALPRKQLERTIQKMTKLSETPMKPEKLVDLMSTLAGLQGRLLDMDRDAKQDALMEEKKRVESELAALSTRIASDNSERHRLEWENICARRKEKEEFDVELKRLKSDNATLQAEKAELLKTNSGLQSANAELTQKVQSLELKNGELQLTIRKLESRTIEELLAEARALLPPRPEHPEAASKQK